MEDHKISDHSMCCRAFVLQCVSVILSTNCEQNCGERSLTQGEDLPQQNAVGPHVTLRGEHLVEDGLWRHPLQREAGLSANQSRVSKDHWWGNISSLAG